MEILAGKNLNVVNLISSTKLILTSRLYSRGGAKVANPSLMYFRIEQQQQHRQRQHTSNTRGNFLSRKVFLLLLSFSNDDIPISLPTVHYVYRWFENFL